MRALSLKQPWATLVVIGAKRFETRSWRTQYTGPIAIHASLKFPSKAKDECLHPIYKAALRAAGYLGPAGLPLGGIIGLATIENCRPTTEVWNEIDDVEREFGDYRAGRWAWQLGDVIRLKMPIVCAGALSLWEVPREVETALTENFEFLKRRYAGTQT